MSEHSWIQELLQIGGKEGQFSEKQLKILEAAVEMFAEKGYAATSTSEIAKKAGVAEGTIFRHYKTKKIYCWPSSRRRCFIPSPRFWRKNSSAKCLTTNMRRTNSFCARCSPTATPL